MTSVDDVDHHDADVGSLRVNGAEPDEQQKYHDVAAREVEIGAPFRHAEQERLQAAVRAAVLRRRRRVLRVGRRRCRWTVIIAAVSTVARLLVRRLGRLGHVPSSGICTFIAQVAQR